MGSFKNKINNNKKKKQEHATTNELIQLKKKMKEQYSTGEYVAAMDTMAEIAERKKMDPEIMYMGASCYFMTGDYERAAKWVNNTLNYDSQNIAARLLLARLCFVEDKVDDGFAILNFVVEKNIGVIRDEEKKTLIEMLGYCNDKMPSMLEKYPSLMEYYKENHIDSASMYVAPKVIQQTKVVSEPPKAETTDESGNTKAKAAVDRLKALLNKSKGNAPKAKLTRVTEMNNSTSQDQETDVVLNSDISLREKISQLNNLAGKKYLNGDFAGAVSILTKALEIDRHDSLVLKNMAYAFVAMGEKDKALEYASAMPMVDFALLRVINGHCHK
ncbi:MAG: tetratricopeptide repeat protein [Anaerovibrio sp.]|uniref:tetratricopeptide repeat protein n=1 Tax=Anaerovibrio sp. TaxID=1872532 RepID=UPI0025C51521|nr:tetratricopeptide repeat protein [Anaerovibrio sp.]MBE6099286.1 tetratricopeptide repeat protein [Anaerovibrio sp.]